MSDVSKYESTLNDLILIETEVAILIEKFRVTSESLREKELQLEKLKQENQYLNKRLSELEFELESLKLSNNNTMTGIVNKQDNEVLKEKIKSLISRIDFHLSS